MPKTSKEQITDDEKKIIHELQKNSKENIDKIAKKCQRFAPNAKPLTGILLEKNPKGRYKVIRLILQYLAKISP